LSSVSGFSYKKIQQLSEYLVIVQELLKTPAEILVSKFQLSSKLAGLVAKATQTHTFLREKRIIGETPGTRPFCPDSSG